MAPNNFIATTRCAILAVLNLMKSRSELVPLLLLLFLSLTAPAGWTAKQPATRIEEAEFAVTPAKGDEAQGR